jgi:hypothetical protein
MRYSYLYVVTILSLYKFVGGKEKYSHLYLLYILPSCFVFFFFLQTSRHIER